MNPTIFLYGARRARLPRRVAVGLLLLLAAFTGQAARADQTAVIDMAGVVIQDGTSQIRSASTQLPAAGAYGYSLTGSIHANGLFGYVIPIGTPLSALPVLAPVLSGTFPNAARTLPFTLMDQTTSNSFDVKFGEGYNITFSITTDIALDAGGTASLTISNVSVLINGVPDTSDQIVFEAGSQLSVSTYAGPIAVTGTATQIGLTTATLDASVYPNGSATAVTFEYGPDTNYGTTVAGSDPGSGFSTVEVSAPITGLAPGTTYHFRVDGASAGGAVQGADQTFTTTQAPLAAFRGKYLGILLSPVPSQETSGLASLTLSADGAFTGMIKLGGGTYRIRGSFGNDRTASPVVAGFPAALQLATVNGVNIVSGTFTPDVLLQAEPVVAAAPAGLAGRYTVRLPHPSGAGLPQGNGFGTLTMDRFGNLRLDGMLGDGTALKAGTQLLQDGSWPLYILLYHGSGSVAGSILFEQTQSGVMDGTVNWFKPETSAAFEPAPFSTAVPLYGSAYPKLRRGAPVLTATSGFVDFNGGDLTSGSSPQLEVGVVIAADNKITAAPPAAGLKLSITASDGLFSGSFVHPDTNKVTRFEGALFPGPLNFGTGLFKGPEDPGSVDFLPAVQ